MKPPRRFAAMARWLILAIACVAATTGLWRLSTATAGLTVARTHVAGTPVTVFSAVHAAAAPVVVIAHGFAGSQQLMQPFAISLARSGYLVVTYDLLGHGRNPSPLTGDVTRVEGATANLVAELSRVAAYARALPGSDGRLAVLGHSMSSDIILRYAIAHPEVSATVAVSMFSPVVTASQPNNLLVIVGALEPGLGDEAERVVGLAAGGKPSEGTIYGNVEDGSARRLVVADGVEHIGVLYSGESLAAARDWLNLVFGRTLANPVETRGLSLGLYFFGIIVIIRFAAGLLPRVCRHRTGSGVGWRRLLPIGLAPAVLTPLLLWKAPVDLLPVPVGDYLAAHFLVFGLLTAVAMRLARRQPAHRPEVMSWNAAMVAIAAATLFCLLAIYLPIDCFVTSFMPTSMRLPLILAMAAGLLPYFIADEWLTRGELAPRGGYLFTKLCFLISLALAIALNLEGLFFLIIIVPVILAFFVVFGLISSWIYRRTRHPLVAAVTNALLFAWAIAVTFPILGQ